MRSKAELADLVISGGVEGGNMLNFIEDYTFRYAEPGYYNLRPTMIVFANWNRDTNKIISADLIDPKHKKTTPGEMLDVYSALEILGCTMEWLDEWATCSGCGRAVRTQPDSMVWKPSYVIGDSELFCKKCAKENGLW